MENLFNDFKASTANDWKNQLLKDLKGEAYESLQWLQEDGIILEPFYTAENQKQAYEPAFTHHDWEISTPLPELPSEELNKVILNRLDQGASSFLLNLGAHDLHMALNGVKLNYIHSAFYVNRGNVNQWRTYLETHYDINEVQASLFYQPFDASTNLEEWFRCMEFFFDHRKLKALSVDMTAVHNQNASPAYEVAMIFSALIEQYEFLNHKGCILASDFVVKTAVNSDFFTQIAKLRAIRRLWNCFKKEYNIKNNIYLMVETSLTNKTIGDKYNNLLRAGIESIAAVSGGCNELLIHDYDVFASPKDKMAARLAINQQLMLKHESYFDKMADVSCGAYMIEHLTDTLATKALEIFKGFEKEGGYLACAKKGLFTRDLKAHAAAKQQQVDNKLVSVIGVNKFKNTAESISLSPQELETLQHLAIANPALNYELQNFVNHA